MRRNIVTIIMDAKDTVDEEALIDEEAALDQQRKAIHDMLEAYNVHSEFDVNVIVSIEDEEEQ